MNSSEGYHEGYQADSLRTFGRELLIAFEYFPCFSDIPFDSLRSGLTKAIKSPTLPGEHPILVLRETRQEVINRHKPNPKNRRADGNDLTIPRLLCINKYMPTKRKQSQPITEVLRDAINDSELSFAALERETGVVRQSLMKFARGERSLRLDMADRLALFFGLEIVKRKAK